MKKTIIFIGFLFLFFLSSFCQAQRTVCYYDGSVGGTVNQPFELAHLIAGKGATDPLYPFKCDIFGVSSTLLPQFTECVDQAKKYWGFYLGSPDASGQLRVTVKIVFEPLGATSHVYAGTSVNAEANFVPTCYSSYVVYPQSLANFMWDQYNTSAHGSHFGGYDMEIDINSDLTNWNMVPGSCPPGDIDLTTIITHEMCHGLGMISAAVVPTGSTISLIAGANNTPATYPGQPFIYDMYVNDNGTGSTSPTSCITPLYWEYNADPTVGYQEYCKGMGMYSGVCASPTSTNSLYFNPGYFSTTYGLPGVEQLFLPSGFISGSSIAHANEILPAATATNTELMQPSTATGNILTPSHFDRAMLSAIGWNVLTYSGIGDYVTLQDPSGGCTGLPNQVFDIGVGNDYCLGGSYAPNAANATWAISLYDQDGTLHNVASQYTGAVWTGATISASSMPSGVNWYRDINGRVAGVLTYSNLDGAHATVGIGLNYAPDNIEVGLNNISAYSCYCNQEQLNFYSPGATTYNIWKRVRSSAPGGLWSPSWILVNSTPINAPVNSYTFTGSTALSMVNDYEFQVIASNANGNISSSILYRYHCQDMVVIAPNPVSISASAATLNVTVDPSTGSGQDGDNGFPDGSSDAYLGADGVDVSAVTSYFNPCGPPNANPFLLTSATLVNVANPNITYTYSFDGSTNSTQLNISGVTPGIYSLTAYSNGSGESVSAQVEIDN